MSLQFLTNANPPPPQSLLEYDVEPGTVFISTGSQFLYVDLTITVTNTTSAPVNCLKFQFGFLAGADAGNLTTVNEAGSVTATSDQNEWNIATAGFSDSTNPNLYLFAATPTGLGDYLPLDAGSSLTFHLTNILVDQSVGEGDAPVTIVEETGTNRRTRRTVEGTISITKEIGSLAISNFSAIPSTPVPPGTPITLSWTLAGSDHWQLYDSDTSALLYDSSSGTPPNLTQWPVPPQELTPEQDTNYELIAWAGALYTSKQATAMVSAPQVSAQGPTQPVDALSEVTITWQTVNATSVVIEPTGQTANADSNQGTFSVQPTEDTQYTLTATGANNTTAKAPWQVYVIPPAVVSFAATPNLFAPGATVELSWQTQSGVSASLSRTTFGSSEIIPMGSVDLNSTGHAVEPPNGLTTYILTVESQGQTTGQVAVANPPQTIDTLSSLLAEILYDNVNLRLWELSGWTGGDVILWRNASSGNLIGQTNYSLQEDLLNAMAFDGQYVWVTSNAAGLIQIQASSGNIVATGIQQANLNAPSVIAYDAVNQLLWVLHNHGASVSRIKTSDQSMAGPDIAFAQVQARPAFDGVNAWFADGLAQELYIVQASDGTIVQHVPSNATCLTFDGNNIWAGCADGHVRKFDGQGNVLANYQAANGALSDILFDGTNLWTANLDDQTVSMIDAADGTLLAAFPMGGVSPALLAFDGASVWILCKDFNAQTSSILKLFAGNPPAK